MMFRAPARQSRYTGMWKHVFARESARREPAWLACTAVCFMRLRKRTHRADRQLQNTHMSKDTRRVATPSHTALAACLLTGAGAAETGARRRQPPFDPIRGLTPGREVGRHGHGRRGNAHKPCSRRSGANPHRGAFGTRTALPGLGRWADEVAEMRQGHEGKPGLLGTTRECVGLWIA